MSDLIFNFTIFFLTNRKSIAILLSVKDNGNNKAGIRYIFEDTPLFWIANRVIIFKLLRLSLKWFACSLIQNRIAQKKSRFIVWIFDL